MKQRPPHRSPRLWQFAGILCCLLAAHPAAILAQENPPPAPPADPAPAATPAPKEDPGGEHFARSCSSCHSLNDAKATGSGGPGLIPASKWPTDQIKTAIQRMVTSTKVPPLKDDEITGLIDFIKDSKAPDRLAAAREKEQAKRLAKMEPADAGEGKQLFTGAKGLKNSGLACAACHAVNGDGGNLGPDLTKIFAKLGKDPLISAISNASFKIMAPHYQRHPVTEQEAMHLAEYFSKVDPNAPLASAPMFAQAGAGLAGLMLAGMTLLLRSMRSKRGRDTKLTRRRK